MTYDEIAAGAGLGRSWLDKFMQGRFKDYGITKVLQLRDFLMSAAPAIPTGTDQQQAA